MDLATATDPTESPSEGYEMGTSGDTKRQKETQSPLRESPHFVTLLSEGFSVGSEEKELEKDPTWLKNIRWLEGNQKE